MSNKKTQSDSDGAIRKSIAIRLIRHAESRNNQVYRNARYIYRGGTPDYDEAGWMKYVHTHRSPDPALSDDKGVFQAEELANHLVPHLIEQASRPVRFIVSPMRRALQTIRPTIQRLESTQPGSTRVDVHAHYAESEGCHDRGKPREGMNPEEITSFLSEEGTSPATLDFESFPDPSHGWWWQQSGAETRTESEARAAKFFLWLNEYLDNQIQSIDEDIFDAGVAVEGEEDERDHDYTGKRLRKRRMVLLVGHGDFMSLVLKRTMAGYGHYVENEGVPHRSAFTHHNTGITELEYFGSGRFLVMGQNLVPHLHSKPDLLSGGSLKDGWSYLVPQDEAMHDLEVSVAFADELDKHVSEQAQALKALYLSSSETNVLHADSSLSVVEDESSGRTKHFIVNRGLQVVAVATYSEATGHLYDVAVRPTAGQSAGETLLHAVKKYSQKIGRSGSLLVVPSSELNKSLFKNLGFNEAEDANSMEIDIHQFNNV